MKNIIKLVAILLIHLSTYPLYAPFFKDYVMAQPVNEPEEATCNAVREWELT